MNKVTLKDMMSESVVLKRTDYFLDANSRLLVDNQKCMRMTFQIKKIKTPEMFSEIQMLEIDDPNLLFMHSSRRSLHRPTSFCHRSSSVDIPCQSCGHRSLSRTLSEGSDHWFGVHLIILVIIMKIVLVITILCLFHRSSATFGPGFVFPSLTELLTTSTTTSTTTTTTPPTTTTTEVPTTTSEPVSTTTTEPVFEESALTTSVLDLILDVANESLHDEIVTQVSVFSEEVTFNPFIAPPPPRTVCVKSNTLTLLRWIERRVRRLFHALLELLVIPLELVRGAIGLILSSIADSIFNLFGYAKLDCRYRFTCNTAVVTSQYLPRTIRSFFERNWDLFVSLATKLKILDFENEYMQAAVVGSFEGNCKIYDHAKCN